MRAGVTLWIVDFLVPGVWMGAMGLSFGAGATTLADGRCAHHRAPQMTASPHTSTGTPAPAGDIDVVIEGDPCAGRRVRVRGVVTR